MLLPKFLAAGGLLFAFEHSTIAGKLVLLLLCIVSIFSWSIMITKMRVIRFARKQTARFRAAFRQDRQPLRLFESHAHFPGAPLMPAVLMVESMSQVAAILLLQREDAPPDSLVYLRGVNDAKFRRQVVPGDRLRLEVSLGRRRASRGGP